MGRQFDTPYPKEITNIKAKHANGCTIEGGRRVRGVTSTAYVQYTIVNYTTKNTSTGSHKMMIFGLVLNISTSSLIKIVFYYYHYSFGARANHYQKERGSNSI